MLRMQHAQWTVTMMVTIPARDALDHVMDDSYRRTIVQRFPRTASPHNHHAHYNECHDLAMTIVDGRRHRRNSQRNYRMDY